MGKIHDALADLKQRVSAAPPDQRAKMQLSGLNSALAQAIADARSAGMTSAQVATFEAVQQAMDADLGAADLTQPAQGQGAHLASPPPVPPQ